MENLANIVAAYATGERDMGKYTGHRLSPPRFEIAQLEIAQLAFSLYEFTWPAGRTPYRRLGGCRTGIRAALLVTAKCRRTNSTH
jgi:hypothetical protein